MHPTTYCPTPGSAPPRAPTLPDRVTRDNSVLLFVDCQVGPTWDLEFGSMRRRMADLAGSARRAGVPVIISAIDLENRGPVIPELMAAVPGASIVKRYSANPWNDAAVRIAVRETGRSTLIVVGAAAELCVSLCAMSASTDGMGVYAILELPGTPPQNARWFGDRLIMTTCALVATAVEKRTSRPSRDSGSSRKSMSHASRMSQERRVRR